MDNGTLKCSFRDSPKEQTWAKLFALTLFWLLLPSCYSTQQAWYQGQRLLFRDNVDDVITNPTTDQAIRQKLNVVADIVKFAQNLGLNAEDAYQHYVDTKNGPVSFLVQASHPDKFESVTWWFPFVGSVPYLGFFHQDDREELANELMDEGYDVARPSAQAFSSLGWFEDPIYTGMLRGSDGDLAELFLHELVHRTVWISGNARMNESLAEFVGRRLALKYLNERKLPEEIVRLKAYHSAHQQLIEWVKSLRSELENLYGDEQVSRDEKLRRKAQIIQEHKLHKWPFLDGQPLHQLQKRDWNNAWIQGFSLYYEDLDEWEKIFHCLKTKDEIAFLKKVEQSATNKTKVSDLRQSFCAVSS